MYFEPGTVKRPNGFELTWFSLAARALLSHSSIEPAETEGEGSSYKKKKIKSKNTETPILDNFSIFSKLLDNGFSINKCKPADASFNAVSICNEVTFDIKSIHQLNEISKFLDKTGDTLINIKIDLIII